MTLASSIFVPNAQDILCRRYFLKTSPIENNKCENCAEYHETVDQFIDRISFHNPTWREMISSLKFLPNSPTMFSAGQPTGTLSACYVFHIDDNMESIMDTARRSAMVQKWGGGVGYSLSRLRARGTPINSTHGRACGPVAVLKMLSSVSTMITQAGKRDAAQMAVLSVEHPDVREFIHCKDDNPDSISNFNISVAITDSFMDRVLHNDPDAVALLGEMAESAWRTGDPGCIFIDTANKSHPTPHLGLYEATNPCGEQFLLDNESCTLGHINLGKLCNGRDIDWTELEYTVRSGVDYLNHVVDLNMHPLPEIREANSNTRRIGLGVMGLADLFARLHIHYDSIEAVTLSGRIASAIREYADKQSNKLAIQYGPYPAWNGTGSPFRNACRLTVAPTGTTSFIADCSSGIEPHYALEFMRQTGADIAGAGKTYSVRASILDHTDGFVPHTALQIDGIWHLRHQAEWQSHVDNSISKTINLPNSAVASEIYDLYINAWKSGCKGITVFRDGCRDKQVLTEYSTTFALIDDASYLADANPAAADVVLSELRATVRNIESVVYNNGRRHLPDERPAINHKFNVGGQEGYINVGLFEDGSPGELFITMSKQGSTVQGLADTIGILTSYCLQHGVSLDQLTNKLSGVSFEPSGFTTNPLIRTATSVIDYIFHFMRHRFIPETLNDGHHYNSGTASTVSFSSLCPECGSRTMFQEGCQKCINCGWSKC